MKRPRDEGAALLSVLMLVALMAGLIALGVDRLNGAQRRGLAQRVTQEARLDLLSAEAVAVARIERAVRSQDVRSLMAQGDWRFSVPVPGGRIDARLDDGQNCYNLNALFRAGGLEPDPQEVARLGRLLALSGWSAQEATPVAAQAAQRIALYGDVHELAALPGATAERMARLKSWACVLPVAQPLRININTLRLDQAGMLVTLIAPDAPVARVESALHARPAQGFADTTGFAAAAGVDSTALVTQSQWFQLDLSARLGDAGLSERVLIDARARPARVVRRIYGGTG